MCATSKGKPALGLFLFFCSFQDSLINVTATKLLASYIPLEENKDLCPCDKEDPQIMVLITFLFTSLLLAVAIKLKHTQSR